VRVALVIPMNDRVLLAGHHKGGRDYWVFPGGRLQAGEHLDECGLREVEEEAGIRVKVGPLLYVSDRLRDGTPEIDFFFLGCWNGRDEPRLGGDPEAVDDMVLTRLSMVGLEEFSQLEVLPQDIKSAVIGDWERGFNVTGRYIRGR